jgi:uncharacterized protein (TIGR02186 family)
MRGVVVALSLLTLGAGPATAQTGTEGLHAAVTEDVIEVTSDFRGASITVFGVAPSGRAQGDLVVTLRGPSTPLTIMRKRRVFGLWLNTDPVRFSAAPSFYALLSAKPVREIAGPQAIWAQGLDPAAHAKLDGPTPGDADPARYRAAIVRLMSDLDLYQENPRGLDLRPGGLFRAKVRLPANAPPGAYEVNIHLFRRGKLVGTEQSAVLITRQGVERRIYDLAVQRPLFYGLATVALALASGWLAATAFRRG